MAGSGLDLRAVEERLLAGIPAPYANPKFQQWSDVTALLVHVRAVRTMAQKLLHELRALEWEGCDPSAMPVCYACKRDRPEDTDGDPTERHDSDCTWLALVQEAASVLGAAQDGETPP